MRVYVVICSKTNEYKRVFRKMSDVAFAYNLSAHAIRMQFMRKGYYSNKEIDIIREIV